MAQPNEMVLLTRTGFTYEECADILDAAVERGMTAWELIHQAVMDDLYR